MAEYIEREAALRPFVIDKQGNRIHETDVDNWLVDISIRQVKRLLREVPAADVAPVVHGEWVDCENHNDIEQCSVCGMIYQYPSFYRYNYCPNCGARMDGDE